MIPIIFESCSLPPNPTCLLNTSAWPRFAVSSRTIWLTHILIKEAPGGLEDTPDAFGGKFIQRADYTTGSVPALDVDVTDSYSTVDCLARLRRPGCYITLCKAVFENLVPPYYSSTYGCC